VWLAWAHRFYVRQVPRQGWTVLTETAVAAAARHWWAKWGKKVPQYAPKVPEPKMCPDVPRHKKCPRKVPGAKKCPKKCP
jgi:hypothetical protein